MQYEYNSQSKHRFQYIVIRQFLSYYSIATSMSTNTKSTRASTSTSIGNYMPEYDYKYAYKIYYKSALPYYIILLILPYLPTNCNVIFSQYL